MTQAGRIGGIGSIVGLLALVAAVLPLWVLPVIFPPKPIDQVIVDTARKVKDRVIAKAKGAEYQAPAERNDAAFWYLACPIAAVSLGLVAIGLATFSFLRREDWRYAGAAAALGAGAIAFEFAAAALGALILLLIVFAVLRHFDISL